MKIPYFPGCTLKTTAKNFEISALEVSKVLDIELIELPKWNCCGTVTSLTSDDLMHHLAPIRDLIRVEEMNESGLVDNEFRVVALCTMCFNVLKRSNQRIKERPDEFKKLNDFMYLEKDYQGKVEVIHYMELLRDIDFSKVSEKVKKPLKGLKVSPYYGCLMLRPKEVGIDDPESPTIQGDLLSSIGAEVIDNPFKTRCCGSYQTVRDKYAVAELAYDIITRARKNGAEMITSSCPLCLFNLADRQKEVMERHPEFEPMPVLYFTQLMALAFGLDEKYFGFEDNFIDPRPLLREKGLLK
ncbi:CoB--CoM heterodisulfide reductase iron-sulfur subunit B family protein [bacterium]|nr:CoB--CoM heterodisulfide reductase iron-sulfur subunit B family protein [bacterium]